MLRDSAKGERTRREDSGRIAAIGASVATRLRPLFDDAVLTDAERATVLREVLLTLDQTDAEQMIESRVDPRRLREALFASRLRRARSLLFWRYSVRRASAAADAQSVGPRSLVNSFAGVQAAESIRVACTC